MANNNHQSTGLGTALFNAIKHSFSKFTKEYKFMSNNNQKATDVKTLSVNPVSYQITRSQEKMFKHICKVLGLTTVVVCLSSASAQAGETFSVKEGMALNTNKYFRLIDGQPRMSIYQRNDNDPDQIFDRLSGNNGAILLKHRSTGNCLNAHYLWNGAEMNVWPCNASDPDQNWKIIPVSDGYNLIQRAGTNLCVDTPTRDNSGKVHLWTCDGNNGNQRWKSSNGGGVNPPPSGQINLPFKSGQTWYVCQGYQGYVSHGSYYALDLTVSNQDFGSTACWANDGNVSKSAGQPLLAPASGTVYHVDRDLVCLSIDNNRSLLLGHIDRTVSHGARVNKDDILGYISKASSVNGGFSHIHLEGRKSSNCLSSTTAPLTEANGFKLNGVGDLPDISGRNDYFKRALTRP